MTMKYDALDLSIIKNSGLFKNDASDEIAVFFARELESVKAKTYDQKLPNLNAARLFPVSSDADPGAQVVTFQSYGSVGVAKIIANYADDLPRVDIKGEEHSVKVFSIGESYGYSVQDVLAAKMAGKSLNLRKATAARRANDTLVNKLAFKGDKEHGIVGILDHPNISTYVLTGDGSGSSTKFKDKTPTQILRDLNAMVNSIVDVTNGVEIPDTLVLPLEQYNYIATTLMSDQVSDSILTVFTKNNKYIKTVEQAPELKGAGASGKDIALVYRKDSEALSLEIPLAFTQYAPQAKGLEFEVPCMSKTAGVIVYYPLSVCKAEGI